MFRRGFVLVALATLGLPAMCRADFILGFLDGSDSVAVNVNGSPVSCGGGETCSVQSLFTGEISSGVNLAFNIFDTDRTTLSDTLLIQSTEGSSQFNLTFASDVDGAPLTPLTNATSLFEDGTVQTAATIPLNGSSFAGQNLIIQYQSDVEAQVPEPASVVLLASVLGLAGLIYRKRRMV